MISCRTRGLEPRVKVLNGTVAVPDVANRVYSFTNAPRPESYLTPEGIPQDKKDVSGALRESPHVIRVPCPAERDI